MGGPQLSVGKRLLRHWASVLAVPLGFAVAALGPWGSSGFSRDPETGAAGERTFISRCAMCHGTDGRGAGRAPDIATSRAVRQLSDADLDRILEDGIPSRGMPSFRALGSAGVRSVIAYVRVLQGRGGAAMVNGNPGRGRGLFFGAAGCSTCHMIHGEGGFLGPDLSDYFRSHSAEEIRKVIVDPSRDLSRNADTVTAVTRDGRTLVGIARNEDNFSLQLQALDGSFYLLLKSDLAVLSHDHRPVMPSDYASRLSAGDLDDLVCFLLSPGGTERMAQ